MACTQSKNKKYLMFNDSYSIPSFLHAKLNFENGVPSGTQNWYDPAGNIIETAFYQKGKRLNHKKILQKTKTQNSDENNYENKKSEVIHKFLSICSKSKVKKERTSPIYSPPPAVSSPPRLTHLSPSPHDGAKLSTRAKRDPAVEASSKKRLWIMGKGKKTAGIQGEGNPGALHAILSKFI